jgi:3-phosphoshikimate 1-carboxyvinyltransferase
LKLHVRPASALRGEIVPPGDKSLSHRAALFASLAEGESRIENLLLAGVTRPMLQALSGLGVAWHLQDTTLLVEGLGLHGFASPARLLDCGNSATTMRLLVGALAGAGCAGVLDGSDGLRQRPMRRVVEPLRDMGAKVEAAGGDHPPIVLHARSNHQPLRGMSHQISVASAQVKTAILLAALSADDTTTIREPGPSRDHSERMLAVMGAPIECLPARHTVRIRPPSRPLKPVRFTIPGDISSAAFIIVAGLIVPGSEIEIRDVGLNPSRTGLITALKAMGARIEVHEKGQRHNEPVGDLHLRSSPLHATRVDGELVVQMIDEFPAFAVAAAYAAGRTTVEGAAELRHKETDRISSLVRELRSLGAAIEEQTEGFTIEGGRPLGGGVVQSHGDHRLAMALTVAGLGTQDGVEVEGAEIIAESYPGFEADLCKLGVEAATC